MNSTRCILSVKYTPAHAGAGRRVAGFLRYVQYRDHHERAERDRGVQGLVRYVAYRDRSLPHGRLFNHERTVGDRERRQLTAYISRSLEGRSFDERRPGRAVYRLVLSPERERGLDLRALTRATMNQLARDLDDPLPPWIAAEHRNTDHPHVHIVLAAQRGLEPGHFRELVITEQRLARMKEAMTRELVHQRERERGEERTLDRERDRKREPVRARTKDRVRDDSRPALHQSLERPRRRVRPRSRFRGRSLQATLQRLARNYQREAELEAQRQRDRGMEMEL